MVGTHGIKLSISSTGAYIARCYIDLYDDIGSLSLLSGNIYAGQTRVMDLPDTLISMKIRCENQRLIGKWGDVFTHESNGPQLYCYKMGGTTFHPSYSSTIC